MNDNLSPKSPNKNFEDIRKVDENGVEYWEARGLMPILEYLRWENFSKVIDKAQTACILSGQMTDDHFREVTKGIKGGKGAIFEARDYVTG